MADQLQQTTPVTPGSMAPLVTGIIDDLQELIKQNLALFKVEVREDFKKTKEAAASLGVGIGLAVVGALHLTLMLVYLLWWAFDSAAREHPGLPLGLFRHRRRLVRGSRRGPVLQGQEEARLLQPAAR